ncbi:Autophagy-related protein [Mycena kentingensis (nom. inval.)]|nr:Autophagy-related protein [Mycena kentingensis (nom. inval.)]
MLPAAATVDVSVHLGSRRRILCRMGFAAGGESGDSHSKQTALASLLALPSPFPCSNATSLLSTADSGFAAGGERQGPPSNPTVPASPLPLPRPSPYKRRRRHWRHVRRVLPPEASVGDSGNKQTAPASSLLPHTFLYLFAFFLLADGLNTTGTLVYICQNDKFSFSFLQNTYLGLAQAITSTLSTFGFWYIQRYWRISTKRMFVVTNCVTILVPLWGMIGIWTQRIGFHNKWEFWAYNVVFGLFQAPYYAYSQTMMAELSTRASFVSSAQPNTLSAPPGFDNMFFGLFGLSNRASSMIGPNVIQAIIDSSGNNWMGFPFLFALCACAALTIWFLVDVEKGRGDAVEWAKGVRAERYAEGGLVVKET